MALIKSCRGNTPQIPESCWLADNATVVGDVKMGENCSIWFNTVVRGDVNSIIMGDNVNIQDNSVVHATYKKTKVILGDNVSIGHSCN
ncbi:MAG: gamma carbonic anhydrase family protein, partial [Crocinitomicaceae bacterium]|nr:gamma carbonic anhydrase family protein [Crocinitomicaceae bacterium]